MLAEALLALTLTTDPWADLFDHGARWPGCTITATAYTGGKPLRRALADIDRAAGIHIVLVPTGGQVTIRRAVAGDPIQPWAAAGALSVGDPTYTAGTVLTAAFVRQYAPSARRVLWQHELGHILGLGHDDNPREVMYLFNSLSRRTTPGYVAALRALYPECKE